MEKEVGFFKKYWFEVILTIIATVFVSLLLFKFFEVVANLLIIVLSALFLVIGLFIAGNKLGKKVDEKFGFLRTIRQLTATTFFAAAVLIVITVLLMVFIPSLIGLRLGTLIIILVSIDAFSIGFFTGIKN
jgi:phosphate/sulfate permease